MHQMLLLRHAKSSRDEPNVSDQDRALAPRGRRDAALMRTAMQDLGLTPDLVLVSTARRTMQTLEVLEPWTETPLIEPLDQLYLADSTQIAVVVRGVAETVRSLLLIGHNPGLQEFAAQLAGASASDACRRMAKKFPTSALAEFTIAGTWSGLARDTARLTRFVTASELRA
jgi:phosphohistidine phosphatase